MSSSPRVSLASADDVVAAPATPGTIAVVVVGDGTPRQLTEMLERVPERLRSRVTSILSVADVDGEVTRVEGLPEVEQLGPSGGYGAGLKRAYGAALNRNVDVVVSLHASGQYPPEVLGDMLKAIDDGVADAVFGVRSVEMLASLEGGVPLYKFLGNRALSTLENLMLHTPLSELHSGHRAITADALRSIPFDRNTNDWHFDTQVIIQLVAAQMRLAEIPIGNYSSAEIGVVNGVRYAAQVARSVAAYKLHEVGLRASPEYEVRSAYAPKHSSLSSHGRLLEILGPQPKRVLDVGSGHGDLAAAMEARGHTVTATDLFEAKVALREFIRADFSRSLPIAPSRKFDVIVLADVLEHLPEPAQTLRQLLTHLEEDGVVLVSLPNAVHWSVRAHVFAGRFEYTNRGILDRGHLRFFTESTARRFFRDAGLEVTRHLTTPVPWENVSRRSRGSRALRALELVDLAAGKLRPNLFGYQHVFRLRRVGG
ncbi:MAG: bifunctional glycosyltransferase/class I SAM-dependent methyltransferase [Deltaproteobacteria bacterium]|nr:bifunctional glycosyltransferase/class I SAM-dependent methyltransferase [Deltaproteobacteria bacterium]